MQQDEKDRFREATASSLRALSGDHNAAIDITAMPAALTPGQERIRRVRGNHGTVKSHIRMPDAERREDCPAMRGSGDAAALFLRHHDPLTHHSHRPEGGTQAALYDLLEQMRCEATGAKNLRGVQANLAAAMEDHCRKRGYANPEKPVAVPLHDAIGLIAAQELGGIALPALAQSAADEWRAWLDRRNPDWSGLRETLADQARFAKLSREMIDHIQTQIPRDGGETAPPQAEQTQQPDNGGGDDPAQEQGQAMTQSLSQAGMSEHGDGEEHQAQSAVEAEDDGQQGENGNKAEASRRNAASDADERGYHAYCKDFDEQIEATKLADLEELQRLRALLDGQLEPYQTLIARMANRLQRLLLAKQQRAWEFDVDDGWLDTRRLARMVADPTLPTSYKREKETDFRDSCISLLIDNSGSMRGRPIAVAALTTDILARTLERCGLKVEILGFTTATWKGGQSRGRWMEEGRPPAPGRLNDLRHIIYKAADMPMRRARLNLGLMLKEGLLKENIDGEALQWAAKRLLRRPEERKILMVISDGAPVDDSTLSANPSDILESHLKTVVGQLQSDPRLTLMAIGIGHDVSRYYARAMTIRDSADLGEVMIEELSTLFS